jgi:drug/metabolite transporter (DMT)-like permease
MPPRILIGFLLLLGFDVASQIGFKFAATAALPVTIDAGWLLRILSHPAVYLAVLGYIGAFFTWLSLLKHAPIGPAFAATHLDVVAILPFAVLLFGETIGWHQIFGAAAILAGIACLAMDQSHNKP